MRVFVMGDIHGGYKALVQCLERSCFDYEKDMLIQLGDVTDGYPQVYECVECLLKIPRLIALKGNHDDWLDDFIRKDLHPASWNFGGKGTLVSYLEHAGKKGLFRATGAGYKTSLQAADIPLTHRAFFASQHLYYIDEQHRCFVHAGFNRYLSLDKQRPADFYWDRDMWSEALHCHTYQRNRITTRDFFNGTNFKEVFIGHTPTTKLGTDKPLRALNILNLDTGAGHRGKLTIMNVDSKQYWQSDPLPELYPQNYRYI
ncbi:metallophosphoesterase [Chitinophaga tropicalis]|uniref:Phosphoesterase n=1 Tax=Chitinophaga tropicalis TaxID=2683588 RepID=A0A7K1U032_9BACT|nr:metallophosphoesterase [Chitinophaga tropicalis]MVT07727.1 phosphoesterase [Chitinophaga tropicalis]